MKKYLICMALLLVIIDCAILVNCRYLRRDAKYTNKVLISEDEYFELLEDIKDLNARINELETKIEK